MAKTETIKLSKKKGAKENSTIKFKEGTLRKQLKMKRGDTFTKAEMRKMKKVRHRAGGILCPPLPGQIGLILVNRLITRSLLLLNRFQVT